MGNCANSKQQRKSEKKESFQKQNSQKTEHTHIENSNSVNIPIYIQLPSNITLLLNPTMTTLQDIEYNNTQSSFQHQSNPDKQKQILQLDMKSFDTIGIMKFQIYQYTKVLPKNQLIYLKVDDHKFIFNDQFLTIKSLQQQITEHIKNNQNASKKLILKLAVNIKKSSMDNTLKDDSKDKKQQQI